MVRKDVELTFAQYMDTRMHFEKVLVLWGDAGLQKTPTAAGIANYLAENYAVGLYCRASTPDALKPAQEHFGKCVPVILEELRARDASLHGCSMSASYLKQLFEVREGGQCRVRNTCVCFHPLQPKILCINDKPEDWLRAVEGVHGTDEQPLKKRLFFVHVDEPVLAEEAVRAHEHDLDALVRQGKRRRLELQGDGAPERDEWDLTPTATGSTSLETLGASSGGSSPCSTPRGIGAGPTASEVGAPAAPGDPEGDLTSDAVEIFRAAA